MRLYFLSWKKRNHKKSLNNHKTIWINIEKIVAWSKNFTLNFNGKTDIARNISYSSKTWHGVHLSGRELFLNRKAKGKLSYWAKGIENSLIKICPTSWHKNTYKNFMLLLLKMSQNGSIWILLRECSISSGNSQQNIGGATVCHSWKSGHIYHNLRIKLIIAMISIQWFYESEELKEKSFVGG